jgi:hypothetical protein
LSFRGVLQTLSAFRSLVEHATAGQLSRIHAHLLATIVTHRVGNRPNCYESRAIKRRPKPRDLLEYPEPKPNDTGKLRPPGCRFRKAQSAQYDLTKLAPLP